MADAVGLRAEEEASAWSSRCEGLRAALQAQEAHAEALERELATRPSAKQVHILRYKNTTFCTTAYRKYVAVL